MHELTANLAKFAQWALTEGAWHGHDLDGGDVQEKAVELGLVVQVPYDPEIHGESEFEIEPGDSWFLFSKDMTLVLANSK
jgi:hypothetical protein